MNRTLGEIRSDLQIRLGFGAAGQAGVVNAPIIDSFIRSADEQLYWQCDWRHLISTQERLTGIEQALYDYPSDANPSRLLQVAVRVGGVWQVLTAGIELYHRSRDYHGAPTRFDAVSQVELWPVPDEQMPLRFEYVQGYQHMVRDNDRPMCDSQLVFLQALVNAKLHYRQSDGQVYADQMRALLDKTMQRQRRHDSFGPNRNDAVLPPPRVV